MSVSTESRPINFKELLFLKRLIQIKLVPEFLKPPIGEFKNFDLESFKNRIV
jgi:hypothetical protein